MIEYKTKKEKRIIMNDRINDLFAVIDLRLILENSLEYLRLAPPAGFSKKIYDKRAETFDNLTKKDSKLINFLEGLRSEKKDEKMSVGDFISSQLEKCEENFFDDKPIHIKEEYGAMKYDSEGQLEDMHVLIETNLNLGLIVDMLASQLYETNDLSSDLSNYLSYNEAYFFAEAFKTVISMFVNFFKLGVEGKKVEIENSKQFSISATKRKKGLADVAMASVGIASTLKMFDLLKKSYRMNDSSFLLVLDKLQKIVEPYDNEEIIKTNLDEDENIENLPSLFDDFIQEYKKYERYFYNIVQTHYIKQ